MNKKELLKIMEDAGLGGHGCFRLADAIMAYAKAEEKAGDEGLRDSQTPSPAYLEENAKLWAEAVKAQQELYRENQRLQCEIDRLSRHPVSEQKAPCTDRTEKLVKVLKAFPGLDCDTEDVIKWICAKEIVLADFEKGAS